MFTIDKVFKILVTASIVLPSFTVNTPSAVAKSLQQEIPSTLQTQTNTGTLVAQNICSTAKTNIRFVNYGHTVFVRKRDGATVHLQRDSKNYSPSVHIWINRRYAGQYSVPVNISYPDLVVNLEGRLMLETWMGRVRQVYKYVPVAKYCPSIWNKFDV